MKGLVSIVTPSYNTGRWIGETIESVLKQTYKNWEMIIVDDCSTDDTDDVISQYKDNRIKFLKNKKNLGAAISRNIAIREAKGEYIAFLDSDDIWTPDKLKKQLGFMRKKKIAFSCAYNGYIDENSTKLPQIDMCPKTIGKRLMYAYNWIGCLTAMYHVPDVGLVQIEDIPKRNDYAIWLKVVKKTNCYCYPGILGYYRVRKKSVSHVSKLELIKAHYNMFRICEHKNKFLSFLFTTINMIMAVFRKKVYVKKEQ